MEISESNIVSILLCLKWIERDWSQRKIAASSADRIANVCVSYVGDLVSIE